MLRTFLSVGLCISAGSVLVAAMTGGDISTGAQKLHFSSIVVDTHDDTTQRFLDGKFDLGVRNSAGRIDIPPMREGGLGAIFFSIWIPSKTTGREAVKSAPAQTQDVSDAG